MKKTTRPKLKTSSERASLRRRMRRYHQRLDEGDGAACYEMVDPLIRAGEGLSLEKYVAQIEAFHAAYREIKPLFDKLNLHLKATTHQKDKRPFAYAYVVWQDARGELHLFRERWVKDNGRWYTRVAGLVANRSPTD